ncbi:DUF167 domain-containing protein [Candidatus Hydrogenedentota bacterium]
MKRLHAGSSETTGSCVSRDNDGVAIAVRVAPRARTSEVTGVEDGAVKMKLNAPPVEGKANKALIAFMAELFGVRKSAVRIARGDKSRHKLVKIAGISEATAREKLE